MTKTSTNSRSTQQISFPVSPTGTSAMPWQNELEAKHLHGSMRVRPYWKCNVMFDQPYAEPYSPSLMLFHKENEMGVTHICDVVLSTSGGKSKGF